MPLLAILLISFGDGIMETYAALVVQSLDQLWRCSDRAEVTPHEDLKRNVQLFFSHDDGDVIASTDW